MLALPDTPRWLCEQERSDEVVSILARIDLEESADESTPAVILLRRQIETANPLADLSDTESFSGVARCKICDG